jgi:hypothetical protein
MARPTLVPALVLAALAGACARNEAPPAQQAPEAPPRIAVALRLEAPSEAEEELAPGSIPASRTSLVLIHDSGDREVHDLGTVDGACTPRPPHEGELARIECWWAGAGTHVIAKRGTDDLFVVTVPIDEMTGPGTSRELARIPLPDDAQLDPITP